MSEVNYAELQKEIDTDPRIEVCKRQGVTHASYGWCKQQKSNWNDAQRAASDEGYESYKRNQ